MPFKKGRAKTGGRKAGTLNRGTIEMKSFAIALLEEPEYQKTLRARILNGEAPHMEVLLHHYIYGKPKSVIDLNDRHITVIVDRVCSEADPKPNQVCLTD